ncbi:MAG: sigma-70 family RNA polymerase sigma factor [Anaerovoracaceae bacterium]
MQENNSSVLTYNYEAFSGYSDEKLVALAHAGEEGATELLIRRYKTVIRNKASLYFVAGADADDVVQEGMIGLLKAIRSYDRSRNAKFRTYADLCINSQIYTAMKHAATLKNSPLNNSVSIDNDMNGEDGGTFAELFSASTEDEPESALIFKEKMKKLEAEKAGFFSEFESRVLMGFLQGKNCAEIGETMDKSAKSIDNALQRIRKKLENHLTGR